MIFLRLVLGTISIFVLAFTAGLVLGETWLSSICAQHFGLIASLFMLCDGLLYLYVAWICLSRLTRDERQLMNSLLVSGIACSAAVSLASTAAWVADHPIPVLPQVWFPRFALFTIAAFAPFVVLQLALHIGGEMRHERIASTRKTST